MRCRDPRHVERTLVYGGELGVLMSAVGEPGVGSPILLVEDIRDVPRSAAEVLRTELDVSAEPA